MATREDLLIWIERTRRHQRTLAILVTTSTALSLALWFWRKPIGAFGVVTSLAVGLVGFWVTRSHLDEWSNKLRERP